MAAPLSRAATEPVIRSAAASQAAGIQRLSGITQSVRRIVTLPTIPSSASVSEPVPSPSQPAPPPSLLPLAPVHVPTLTERRETEHFRKEEDRRQAVREFGRYKSEGKEPEADLNLLRYWDVSLGFSSGNVFLTGPIEK